MKRIAALAALALVMGGVQAQDSFRVRVNQPEHGKVTVTPAIPEDGRVKAGTVISINVEVTDPGWVFESCFYLSTDKGMFYPTNKESMENNFKVTVNSDMSVGGSIIEASRLEGYRTINDVVYAQPGVKPLKYDVFIPDGAKNLPCIVIIHGGGWSSNNEDIMRGLARELLKGGYVVCSIDYRWVGQMDGDDVPNTMNQLIEDCYGAILHIREHAKEYGIDPNRIGVTGDSAGGHLSSSMITLASRIGAGGFANGTYEFLPTYMPKGMSVKKARKQLLKSIKAAAPSYGVFDRAQLGNFLQGLGDEEAQKAVAPEDNIPSIKERAIPQWFVLGTNDRTVQRPPIERFVQELQDAGQRAELVMVEGASHAFFDWKPDQGTKNTFIKYGVPYAAEMVRFFDSVLK